jgi:cytosine/adenosine deaminase-related metal-dependent hydrolase
MARTLIKRGHILSLDPDIGELTHADILVEGGVIAEIAPDIAADGAKRIDAEGMIVMPGFVNAHLHTWQTGLRGIAGDWSIPEYLHFMHATIAPRYSADDTYIGNLMGALNQINCGTTTIFDWCHNNATPEHTDAAIDGLAETGIRALFGHGTPKPEADQDNGAYSHIVHPRAELERLRAGRLTADDGLITLAMAALGPDFSSWDVTEHDFTLAREFDLIISTHTWGAPGRMNPDGYARLARLKLLGPNHNLVHGNYLSDDELELILDTGASVTVTPEIELQMSHGLPLTGRVRALGHEPSLGVDVESGISGDMFTVMRMALQTQRHYDNAKAAAERKGPVQNLSLSARDVLEWAICGNARAMKLDDRIGSLTPGKQADLIMIDKTDLNLFPVNDPVETVVFHANSSNVDTVMIAGVIRKQNGKLLFDGLADKRRDLLKSSRRILEGIERAH